MAQHKAPSRALMAHPVRADVDKPFDWSGVRCEFNQNYCQGDSVALADIGATVMIAGQAPTGMRAERHLCKAHYRLVKPNVRVVQNRPGAREER